MALLRSATVQSEKEEVVNYISLTFLLLAIVTLVLIFRDAFPLLNSEDQTTFRLFGIGLGGNFAFKVTPLIASGTYTFVHTQGVAKGCYSFPSLSPRQRSVWATDFGKFLAHDRVPRVVRRNAANEVSVVPLPHHPNLRACAVPVGQTLPLVTTAAHPARFPSAGRNSSRQHKKGD